MGKSRTVATYEYNVAPKKLVIPEDAVGEHSAFYVTKMKARTDGCGTIAVTARVEGAPVSFAQTIQTSIEEEARLKVALQKHMLPRVHLVERFDYEFRKLTFVNVFEITVFSTREKGVPDSKTVHSRVANFFCVLLEEDMYDENGEFALQPPSEEETSIRRYEFREGDWVFVPQIHFRDAVAEVADLWSDIW